MPFTLAHAAAILPLVRRRGLALLPLVAGSIGPDLHYFLPASLGMRVPDTHSLRGGATLSVAAAFLLLIALVLLRRLLVEPLWGAHRAYATRLLADSLRTRRDWLLAVPAVYLGVALHLLWDSFTHRYGWPVQQLPLLRVPLDFAGIDLPVFRLLQWLSSMVGLAILALWYRRELRGIAAAAAYAPGAPGWRRPALGIGLLLACAFGVERALHLTSPVASMHGRMYAGSTAAVAAFAAGYLLLAAATLGTRVLRARGHALH